MKVKGLVAKRRRVEGELFHTFIRLSWICLFLTLVNNATVSAQGLPTYKKDSTAIICRKVISIMEKKALGNDMVDWNSYRAKAEQLLSSGANSEEVFQFLGSIFADIGDFHGGFFYKEVRYGMKQPDLNVRLELQDAFSIGAVVKSRILDGEFGYILIPPVNGFASDRGKSVGVEIDSVICNISPKVTGWIVDLRLNTGGSMWPMIGGLQALLGEGTIGAFVSQNQETIEWTISKGIFKAGTDSVAIINNLCDFKTLPVVVLISQITASSGEAVAIAFKGRNKTIFIGEPTSGYITALNSYHLSNRAMLLVAEANMCDRNGYCYTKTVTPDITLIDGDHLRKLENDVKVRQALSWLKQKR